MQRDGLETDEVASAGNGRRDGGGPRRVLSDHDTVTPDAIVDRAVYESGLVDLELYHTKVALSWELGECVKRSHTHLRVLASTPVQVEPPQLARYVNCSNYVRKCDGRELVADYEPWDRTGGATPGSSRR